MLAALMSGHFHVEYVVLPNKGAHVIALPSGPTNVGVILIAGGNVHSLPSIGVRHDISRATLISFTLINKFSGEFKSLRGSKRAL
jgi:hypothetical protein